MLSTSFRASRTLMRAPLTRTFIVPTAIRQADAIQSIYLQALRDYKPRPVAASDAEAVVKKWTPPAAPKSPEGLTEADLGAYEAQAVEVEGQESGPEAVAVVEEDWFDADTAFAEPEEKHH